MPILKVHTKCLIEPYIPRSVFLAETHKLFSSLAGIDVLPVSHQILSLDRLLDIDVGTCSEEPAPQICELFDQRDGVPPTETVVYWVRSLVPPMEGCSTHPRGVPGVVVGQLGSLWSLAHELGHLLGLAHVSDDDRLMTENGAENITNAPPDLSQDEVAIMRASPLLVHSVDEVEGVKRLLASHQPLVEKLQQLNRSEDGGARALSVLARGPDALAASRAVYLAGLRGDAMGVEVVREGMTHGSVHVRIAAAAAMERLPSELRAELSADASKARGEGKQTGKKRKGKKGRNKRA